MQAHIKSLNRKIWQVVEKDFVVLDIEDPTPREEELLQLNDIAVNALYESLEEKVFEHVKDKERAHDIWKHLEETYEGTNAVKGAKLYILRGKWKSFKMDEDETVPEMFHRLSVIVSDLRSLGDKIEDEEFSHHFLHSLPSRFETIATIIVREGLKHVTQPKY